ncbi:MAG: CHRD domain-containing protein [Deltaproteobacteria bacterium]|nr:CHRD domain-containing protein [Deltaproteobacteria bacterium]NND30644.1 CHRD domain-containing protein [Myxococcales bacterium]MBT8465751.1 CHRD domain-containing protein [Deltaproteobacteria bacterium]MBT8482141.1 CHRD domain-containing protein [Deltaproteobacteria bacterium]NNK08263.1 CHRD domain-containing protein [Myxococcales bacterium]
MLLVLGWVFGCAAEEEAGELGVVGFTDATASDLTSKAFRFGPDAGLFPPDDPRFGLSATLFVGELGSKSSSAGFALAGDDGSLQGGVLRFRPCDFNTTFLQPAGEEPQIDPFVSQDFFEWCGVDSEGRLGLQEDDETLPVISEPPTEPSVELDAMVALSSDLVVDPPFPLDERLETGAAELQVVGNVLSYTVTIENVSPTDEVRNGQIRRGGASENGDVLVTLFGEPTQTVRSLGPPFFEGTALTVSVFITPDEAAALTDPATPLYVLFTSQQISSGLMRGQLRDAP